MLYNDTINISIQEAVISLTSPWRFEWDLDK